MSQQFCWKLFLIFLASSQVCSVKIVQVLRNLRCYAMRQVSLSQFEVSIPRTVEIGQENIILNCDYHFDAEEAQQLEIKWYFNKDPSPFFQWIAGLPDSRASINVLLHSNLSASVSTKFI